MDSSCILLLLRESAVSLLLSLRLHPNQRQTPTIAAWAFPGRTTRMCLRTGTFRETVHSYRCAGLIAQLSVKGGLEQIVGVPQKVCNG